MTPDPSKKDRLVAIFFLGVFALNFPILSLAGGFRLALGWPLLVAYAFLAWTILILLIAWVVESKGRARDEARGAATSERIRTAGMSGPGESSR